MDQSNKWEYTFAHFLTRMLLGLLFFMAGWFKVFSLGALVHAEEYFVQGYSDTWIPTWLLWAMGFIIPFIELVCGALLILGFRVRECLSVLGVLLILVTYGHLLAEPLHDMTTHILPRAALILVLLILPRSHDRLSLDALISRPKSDA